MKQTSDDLTPNSSFQLNSCLQTSASDTTTTSTNSTSTWLAIFRSCRSKMMTITFQNQCEDRRTGRVFAMNFHNLLSGKTQSPKSLPTVLPERDNEPCPTQATLPFWEDSKWTQIPVLWFASWKYLTLLASGSVCKNDHHLMGCMITGWNDVYKCLAPFPTPHKPSNSYYSLPPPQKEQRNQNIK